MIAHSAIARCDALIAAGRTDEAVTLIRAAASNGDVDAIYRLAIWLLVGAPVRRDLSMARNWLRRAVAIGHVDGALMEIALTANGSGGPADWAQALALLKVAAINDPVAADHLHLVQAMDINARGKPMHARRSHRISASPDIRLFPNLLTTTECQHIVRTAEPLLEPAKVIDPGTGGVIPHPIRTSEEAVIGPAREDLVIRALNDRIAAICNTKIEQGEPLTVLRYSSGQQYRAHHDTIAHSTNQRRWTILVYLNENYRGGETVFPACGVRVRGRLGDGLLFCNTDDSGQPDPQAIHAGLPVTAGQKWLCTRWIRFSAYDPWKNP